MPQKTETGIRNEKLEMRNRGFGMKKWGCPYTRTAAAAQKLPAPPKTHPAKWRGIGAAGGGGCRRFISPPTPRSGAFVCPLISIYAVESVSPPLPSLLVFHQIARCGNAVPHAQRAHFKRGQWHGQRRGLQGGGASFTAQWYRRLVCPKR